MGDLADSFAPFDVPSRQAPFREDCWTPEATATLVDAWGRRYLELNRGNLRQKDWLDVADAVNALHGQTAKTRRTDVQCKNRIDTLKKKYKTEKAKSAESHGARTTSSSWPFFSRMEFLIGPNFQKQNNKLNPQMAAASRSTPPLSLPSPPMAVALPYQVHKALPQAMVTPLMLPQKRPMSAPAGYESSFRRNYSAMAAAAAAEDDGEDDDEDMAGDEAEGVEDRDTEVGEQGIRRLSKAIERFGEIFERVEGLKQRQMVELEKQRMQFAKDLEVQRMQLFMDTVVQLQKVNQTRR